MTNERTGEVRIDSESDIVTARKIIREAAMAMGFGVTDVTRIVTAASELTRNVFRYAGSGVMRWRMVHAGEVDVDDVSPAVGARFHRRDARVGDDDVEPAELVKARLQRGGQRRLIANIGFARDNSRTGVLDELDRRGQIVCSGHRVGD